MPAVLTQSMIEKLPALPRPQDHRDARLKGLILRVMPNGVKSFYCEYARAKRIWLGRADALGLTEARESARTILADVYRGIDSVESRKPKAEIPTLGAFLTGDYATWARAHHRAHKQNLSRLNTAFKSILNKHLNEVTGLHIERWRAGEIERGLSLETINRDISSIKACFNRAVDWDILKVNPLAKVKKPRTDDNLKVRFLSDAEEIRLRSAIDAREERRRVEHDTANNWRRQRGYALLPDLRRVMFTDHVKPLILLSINTRCRRGELFSLTWLNVDLDRRILTVTGATAKSRRTRHIPLNRKATLVLQGWRAQCENKDGLAFLNEAGVRFDRVNFSWRRLLQDAAIVNFRWHDMRHHSRRGW